MITREEKLEKGQGTYADTWHNQHTRARKCTQSVQQSFARETREACRGAGVGGNMGGNIGGSPTREMRTRNHKCNEEMRNRSIASRETPQCTFRIANRRRPVRRDNAIVAAGVPAMITRGGYFILKIPPYPDPRRCPSFDSALKTAEVGPR